MRFTHIFPLALCAAALVLPDVANAGAEGMRRVRTSFQRDDLDAPSFEIAEESAYQLGVFGNPHAYEYATQFITARLRWGAIHREGWLRGYNQVYVSGIGGWFVRGLENHYYGMNAGLRYNFVQPGSRWVPYISGGVGLGEVDATRVRTRGALGQDFTFNILTAIGVSYKVNDHWKLTGGLLYQHLSNAGLSEPERPNSSLNLLGPQFGATYAF